MRLDGFLANDERFGDLPVRAPVGQLPEDGLLAFRQFIAVEVSQLEQHGVRDGVVKEGAPAGGRADRVAQNPGFGDPGEAGLERSRRE